MKRLLLTILLFQTFIAGSFGQLRGRLTDPKNSPVPFASVSVMGQDAVPVAGTVTDEQGRTREWRAETNAPVVLQRRGWTRASIKPGETITIDGWASRDGKPYIRLRRAVHADGRLIGSAPFGEADQS